MGLKAKRPYILLAEDDADVREVVRDLLAGGGFRVVAAEDGRAALDHLRAGWPRPFVIVTDLQMPRMTGDELLSELRAHPELSRIPVIVITAGALRAGRPDGARLILEKPFDPTALLRAVEEALADATESQRLRARTRRHRGRS